MNNEFGYIDEEMNFYQRVHIIFFNIFIPFFPIFHRERRQEVWEKNNKGKGKSKVRRRKYSKSGKCGQKGNEVEEQDVTRMENG
jgi:hypothetical protein